MSVAAIIPAREGSKRIKGKNFRPFLGKPILSRVCTNVIASQSVDRVFVSSDAAVDRLQVLPSEIELLPRHPKLADDYATLRDVMCDAIAQIEAKGNNYTSYLLVYATAVLVLPHHFAHAATMHTDHLDRFLLSVTDYGHPIQRAFSLDETNALCLAQEFGDRQRTQDFKCFYHDAAAFCIGSRDLWMSEESIIGNKTLGYPLPRTECWDIDTEEDWEICEAIFSARSNLYAQK